VLSYSCLFEKESKLCDSDIELLENMPNQLMMVTPHSTFHNIHIPVGVRFALPLPTRPIFYFWHNLSFQFVCPLCMQLTKPHAVVLY